MSTVSWSRAARYQMWVGDPTDLTRLLDVVDGLINPHRQHRIEQLESDYTTKIEEHRKLAEKAEDPETRDRSLKIAENLERDLADRKRRVIHDMSLSLTVTEGRSQTLRIIGSTQEIMADMDERTCRSIIIEAPQERCLPVRISIEMDPQFGVRLSVVADQNAAAKQQGSAAFSTIQDELRKCRPTWAFLRNWPVLIATFMPVCILLTRMFHSSQGYTEVAGSVVALLLGICAALLVPVVRQWVLPGFAVSRPGRDPLPALRIRQIFAFLAWLSGILIPSYISFK